MGVEPQDKAKAVAESLQWAIRYYQPDSIALQEFNEGWETKSQLMNELATKFESDYDKINVRAIPRG